MNHSTESNLFNEFCNNFATNVENFLNLDNSNSSIGTNNTNITSLNNISTEEVKSHHSTENSPSLNNINIFDTLITNYSLHGINHLSDYEKQNNNYVTYGSNAPISNLSLEAGILNYSNYFSTSSKFNDESLEKLDPEEESYTYAQSNPQSSKNKSIGNIYHYSERNPTRCKKIGNLRLKKYALNCYLVSKSIRKSINMELKLKELYEKEMKSGKIQYLKGRIKKRRNPIADELTWEPLSLFTAFTNFKTSHFENTDYFENIPRTSCVGKINMRMKRAWIRGPNKEKIIKKEQEHKPKKENYLFKDTDRIYSETSKVQKWSLGPVG